MGFSICVHPLCVLEMVAYQNVTQVHYGIHSQQ